MRLTFTIILLIFFSYVEAQNVNFAWAKRIGSTSSEGSRSVAVDASGNSYITGYFAGTVDFDPGTGIFNLTSTGFEDIYVCKLDALGNFVWAKRMGARVVPKVLPLQ